MEMLVRKVQRRGKVGAGPSVGTIDSNGAEIAHSLVLIASSERPRWDGLSRNLADLTHHRGHGLPHFVALLGCSSANNPAAAQQLALDWLRGHTCVKPRVKGRACGEKAVVQLRLCVARPSAARTNIALNHQERLFRGTARPSATTVGGCCGRLRCCG